MLDWVLFDPDRHSGPAFQFFTYFQTGPQLSNGSRHLLTARVTIGQRIRKLLKRWNHSLSELLQMLLNSF